VGPKDAFRPPDEESLAQVPDPWQLVDSEPVVARVAIGGPQVALARRVLGEGAVVEEGDTETVFELEVTHVDGFRSFVLGFLEHAEVREPPELRTAVRDWLEAMA
jgi:predicted DNA-binding transcriptional regulator YafY